MGLEPLRPPGVGARGARSRAVGEGTVALCISGCGSGSPDSRQVGLRESTGPMALGFSVAFVGRTHCGLSEFRAGDHWSGDRVHWGDLVHKRSRWGFWNGVGQMAEVSVHSGERTTVCPPECRTGCPQAPGGHRDGPRGSQTLPEGPGGPLHEPPGDSGSGLSILGGSAGPVGRRTSGRGGFKPPAGLKGSLCPCTPTPAFRSRCVHGSPRLYISYAEKLGTKGQAHGFQPWRTLVSELCHEARGRHVGGMTPGTRGGHRCVVQVLVVTAGHGDTETGQDSQPGEWLQRSPPGGGTGARALALAAPCAHHTPLRALTRALALAAPCAHHTPLSALTLIVHISRALARPTVGRF